MNFKKWQHKPKLNLNANNKIFLCPSCQRQTINLSLLIITRKNNFILKPSSCNKQQNTNFNMKNFVNHLEKQEKQQFLPFNTKVQNNESLEFCCQYCLKINRKASHAQTIFITSMDLICTVHNQLFTFYCKDCELSICEACRKTTHFNHIIKNTLTIDYSSYSNRLKAINDIFKRNKTAKDKLIKWIQDKDDYPIKTRIKWANNLKKAYHDSFVINHQLMNIIKFLHAIALISEAHHDNSLMNLYTKVHIDSNKNELFIDKSNLNNSYYQLRNYFQNHFIYIPKNKVKNIEKSIHWKELLGHSDLVWSVKELYNEQIASCSADMTIKLWNKETRECAGKLEGHKWDVCCITQMSDGTLASGSYDRTIKLWNIKTLSCNTTLFGHSNFVLCLLQLQDGTLVSGSLDKTIKLWKSRTLCCIATLIGHCKHIWTIIQLRDGTLASGSGDCTIRLWDMTKYYCIGILIGHVENVAALIQLKDNILISGSNDKTIKQWNIKTKQCLTTLRGHNKSVSCLVLLSEGYFASGSDDETVKIWDLKQFNCIKIIDRNNSCVTCLGLTTDHQLVYGLGNKFIKLIDIN